MKATTQPTKGMESRFVTEISYGEIPDTVTEIQIGVEFLLLSGWIVFKRTWTCADDLGDSKIAIIF